MDNINFRITTAYHPENIQKLAQQMPQWLSDNVRASLCGALALVATTWTAVVLYNRFRNRNAPFQSRSPNFEKLQPVRTDNGKGKTKFAMEKPGGKDTLIDPSKCDHN